MRASDPKPAQAKPRKKYFKPTVEEKEARVAEAASHLAHGATKWQIHRIMVPKHDVHWRTVDRYIAQAKRLAVERAGKTKPDCLAEAIAFYDSIMLDPKSTRREMMDARERLDKIEGVYAPTAIRLGDPHGKPMAPAVVAPVVQFIVPDNGRGSSPAKNGNGHAEKARRT